MSCEAKVVLIMGPTACGKTDLALALAERYPVDIISVDSAMVYRGMDIGTAKPDAEILRRYPHQLVDIIDPAQSYSAAEFCRDANTAIENSLQQGRWPLLVGGTFLYFNALIHGLADLPGADANIRAQLLERAQTIGWAGLHRELRRVDADSAARIHPNDPQRIQRALEVYYSSGKPLSAWHAEQRDNTTAYSFCKMILAPDNRAQLAPRIEKRFQKMLKLGLIGEVEQLFSRGDLHQDLPSIRSVGYRQVWLWLSGQYSYNEMQEKAVTATRQFAKRQYTWLGREREIPWLNPLQGQVIEKAEKCLKLAGFPL